MTQTLRLGTRGSPLALTQAEETRKKLFSAHPDLEKTTEIEIVPIHTSGEWNPAQREQTFRDLGGNKELFTKEIDEALLAKHIDLAVHSMKDVGTWLPDNIEIMAVLERVDSRDAFIGHNIKHFETLPPNAAVGTSSLRRQAQLLARRPDLRIVPLRGNVDTRLKKLADGQADAIILAHAGLLRLNLHHHVSSLLPTDLMLPAAAQGAIGVAARRDDTAMRRLLHKINIRESFITTMAERALLAKLDGSCHTPIGALAVFTAPDRLRLEGMAAKADGTSLVRMEITGPAADAERLGAELGGQIRAELPPDFFAAA